VSVPPKPVRLHPDVDPWERQPGETTARFSHFVLYRDAGRARTMRAVAEALGQNERHVRAMGAAGLWVERAEAYDRRREALEEATWVDERRKAARDDAVVLNAFTQKVAARLRVMDPGELDADGLIRAMDVVMRHRRLLYPVAPQVKVTGPDGGPLMVQLAEFAQMSAESRRRAIAEMVATVARRTEAAAGIDDDDDDDG
jgi:hypothetical protein